jgi:hypothetical protein
MSALHRIADKILRTQLRVNPPISGSEVAKFESDFGVSIPEDYREFLINVANGGSEPCRLLPLSEWDASYDIEGPDPCVVSERCIVTPNCRDRWLEMSGGPDREIHRDNSGWDPMFGTIAIAEIGCGLFYSMIMTGLYQGRIFAWGPNARHPPHVCPEPSFSGWFENCLDAILAGRPVHFLDGRIR